MATTSSSKPTPGGVAFAFLSETFVPGGSHLIKGEFGQGAANLRLGVAAGAFFGPLGVLLVRANSLAKSQTGQSVTDHLTGAAG